MMRALKALYLATATGACFVFFWGGSILLSWVLLPLVRLACWRRSELEKTEACQDVVGRGFRLFLGAMRWTRTLVFYPDRVQLSLPDRPFVVIANHPTLIDVTAITAVRPRICCVAKNVLFDSIMVGRLLRQCGHINGGGADLSSGVSVILEATERLQRGQSVLVFPEGTRSPADGLRRFRPGAFEIARRAGAPIVQLLISCRPPTLLKGLAWYALPRHTAHYKIRQVETITPDRLDSDAHRAADGAQQMYQNWIARVGRDDDRRFVDPIEPIRTPEDIETCENLNRN